MTKVADCLVKSIAESLKMISKSSTVITIRAIDGSANGIIIFHLAMQDIFKPHRRLSHQFQMILLSQRIRVP